MTAAPRRTSGSAPHGRSAAVSDHRIGIPQGTLFARRWAAPARHPNSKAPIVLFHDSLGCVELWRDFPEQLAVATGRTVVAYDRLGFGRSDPRSGALPLTFIEDEAAIVVPRLTETLGLETIVLLGHSVGGGMASATAARWPERCAAVITESAQCFVEDRTVIGLRAAQAEFARPGQLERLQRYHGAKAQWVLHAWIDTWLSPAFETWSLDDALRGVRAPTLALHGGQDEYGSVRHPERIARLVNAPSRVVILDGCGHIPHREQPGRVLDAVTRFLGNVP